MVTAKIDFVGFYQLLGKAMDLMHTHPKLTPHKVRRGEQCHEYTNTNQWC